MAKELERNLKEQKVKEEAEERKRKVAEERRRKLEAEQEERRKLEEGKKELLVKEKLLADKERQMEEEVARQKAQIMLEKEKMFVEKEKVLAEEVAKKLAEEKEKILAEKKLMEEEALRQREEAEVEKARLAEERRELLRWREEKQMLEEKQRLEEAEEQRILKEREKFKRREQLERLEKDKAETEAASASEKDALSTESNIEEASKASSRLCDNSEAVEEGEEDALDHAAGGNKHGQENVEANALEVEDNGRPEDSLEPPPQPEDSFEPPLQPEDSLELPRQPLLTIPPRARLRHSRPPTRSKVKTQSKLTKHAEAEAIRNEEINKKVEEVKKMEVGNEEKEDQSNLMKPCESESTETAVSSNIIVEKVSVKMTTNMEEEEVVLIVKKSVEKEKANSKKVQAEETVLSMKTEAHSLRETPVKVDKNSKARRRKCEAEFGIVDDHPGNDEIAETVVEDEVEEVKVKTKVKKVKRIIRMGRGPTKAKKRKEEKADVVLLKESLKNSEVVKLSGLRRSSRSQQVSPEVTDSVQDQERVEVRRRSKRGSNILLEQVSPAYLEGEDPSLSLKAKADQGEVSRKSIQTSISCHEAGVQEDFKGKEKKFQRKKVISIEDTPTPYKVKSVKSSSENRAYEKAVNLKGKVQEPKNAIARQESEKIKKSIPKSKHREENEELAKKEKVGKVRQEHENGGDENEEVRGSSLIGEGTGENLISEGRLGARKKRTGDVVLEISSPEKKLRGGRRKEDQEEVSEISLPEKENALLHAKEHFKKDASQELSRATKETLTKPGELFKVKPLEPVKLPKQNLKGVKPGELLRGKEGGVLESSMLTKLAERRRRSEAMSASDWEETLKRFEI